MTIAQAAEEALRSIGQPSSIQEIYRQIILLELYQFNTDVPEHVLRTEIRRKTEGVERIDSCKETRFRLVGEELYGLYYDVTSRKGSSGTRRIHRATDKEDLIKTLMSEKTGPFREIWRVLLFAAVLGYQKGRREPLASYDSGKGIDQGSFANNTSWPGVLYLLSLVEDDSTENLKDDEAAESLRVVIFEEFANGGLEILKEHITTSTSFDTLLTFIHSEVPTSTTNDPNLQITI